MSDKELIKKNFKKSLSTYDSNAVIQRKMAFELLKLIPLKKYENILEIGSYTGLLTKVFCKNFDFDSYYALDIINSFDFIQKINPKINFIQTDIEDFKTDNKFDLILANASLQWCEDFCSVAEKLKSYLKEQGVLAFSVFTKNNLFEIKDVFKTGLDYPDIETIEKLLPGSKTVAKKKQMKFKNSLEILRHLKQTGVNSIPKEKLSYKDIKNKLKQLSDKYKNTITYEPLYVIFQN